MMRAKDWKHFKVAIKKLQQFQCVSPAGFDSRPLGAIAALWEVPHDSWRTFFRRFFHG
jgi:hypothetical protein